MFLVMLINLIIYEWIRLAIKMLYPILKNIVITDNKFLDNNYNIVILKCINIFSFMISSKNQLFGIRILF